MVVVPNEGEDRERCTRSLSLAADLPSDFTLLSGYS